VKIHKLDDLRLYELKDARSGRTGFLCWLDKQTLVLSPARAYVEEAIAKQRGKKQTKLSKEMQTLLDKVDGKQSIWLAARFSDDIKKGLGNSPATRKLVESLQTAQGGVSVTDGVQAGLVIQTTDARSAGEIKKFLEGIKSLLSLAAADHPRYGNLLSDLLDTVKIASDKDAVTLRGQVSAAEIEKAIPAKPKSLEKDQKD
jgi:hypothetical protein